MTQGAFSAIAERPRYRAFAIVHRPLAATAIATLQSIHNAWASGLLANQLKAAV